jgi:hypothetical protein
MSTSRTTPTEDPTALDRTDPERHISEAAEAYRNWGRWGDDDRIGTLNFIGEAERARAATLVRRGASFSLSQPFDMDGPQLGWRRRTNPVHTMLDTGTDAAAGLQGFPHGIGGADDVIAMPLQCSTQWDGLGHIFDRGIAWNGRHAGDVVTSSGDRVTGIEHASSAIVGRGVLLDLGRFLRREASDDAADGAAGELPDGYAITTADLEACIHAQGATSAVGRGDLLLVRTGRYARAMREGWNGYAGGPSAGLSFTTAGWLHRTEIAAVATVLGQVLQADRAVEATRVVHPPERHRALQGDLAHLQLGVEVVDARPLGIRLGDRAVVEERVRVG